MVLVLLVLALAAFLAAAILALVGPGPAPAQAGQPVVYRSWWAVLVAIGLALLVLAQLLGSGAVHA